MIGLLVVLVLASAFFSSSETGMLAINRYRLRHLARSGHRGALRVERLLARIDRLLGTILIGNNFVNSYAATIATLLAIRWFGNLGAALAPVAITLILLVFAEITPKTFAARHPEKIAFAASGPLRLINLLLAPLVWVVGGISNGLLRLFGFNATKPADDNLSPAELRSVVNEAGPLIPAAHQKMLLNILDLEEITVEDIMIPRNEMVGIDIEDDLDHILDILRNAQHTRLPIWRNDPSNLIGTLHLRRVSRLLMHNEVTKADIMQMSSEPHFVPEGTPLHRQLINFQHHRRRLGVVVDEYGDVMGLVTLEDILEEIVGEFTTDMASSSPDLLPQDDGSYLVDGTAHVRDVNKALGWDLPRQGAKTINGLILEYLQDIPESNSAFRLGDYLIEVMHVKDHMVKTARLTHSPR